MRKALKVVSGAVLAPVAMLVFAQSQAAYGQIDVVHNIQMQTLVANVEKGVDVKKAKPGDEFTAKVLTGTTLNDGTVVPAGSVLEGHVDSATPSQHHGDSTLVLTIDKLQLKGGNEIAIKTMIISVASFEKELGGGGQVQDRAFDTSTKDMGRMNGASDAQQDSSGPHPVSGLTLTSAATDPNSGTLTQKKGNVHLSNEDQIQVAVAVVPKGDKVQ